MSNDFTRALAFTLQWEGGYVNDPSDHGGATNKGITQRTYDEWRKACGSVPADVKGITDAEVRSIYEYRYWDRTRCDELAWPICLAVFDAAVNSGVSRSVKWLQTVVDVDADGAFGPKTMAAVLAREPLAIGNDLCDVREVFLRSVAKNPGQAKFLKGWLRRVGALRLLVNG